jgi:hypothetical protein
MASKTFIECGGPVFPSAMDNADGSVDVYRGMTLRDYFAAKALPLAWELEKQAPTGPYSQHMEPTYAGAATRAYYMADAMLKERAK